jgi:outer membrane protein insertion porin family
MVQFQDPYFLDTLWTFGFSGYNTLRAYPAFLRESVGGTLTWGYLLTDDLRAFATYTLERTRISTRGAGGIGSFLSVGPSGTAIGSTQLARLQSSGITSAPQVSILYDTRDDRLYPRRGFYNAASVQVADEATGSQNHFARADASLRYYHPLYRSFVLRLRLEGGVVASRDPEGVPLYERYFVGGIYDVRGFFPASLGPRIHVQDPNDPTGALTTFNVGGNARLVSNAEIEFGLLDRLGLRGVVFLDAGNAFNLEDQYCRLRPGDVDPSIDPCVAFLPLASLRASWGFGLRWFSPLGPLRFEWGVPFRTLPGERKVVFEFTIGNMF